LKGVEGIRPELQRVPIAEEREILRHAEIDVGEVRTAQSVAIADVKTADRRKRAEGSGWIRKAARALSGIECIFSSRRENLYAFPENLDGFR
jgi:hypothetical protein